MKLLLNDFRKQFYASRKMTMAFSKHVDCKQKPLTFFKHKCDELKHSQSNLISVMKSENGNVCEASYKVSHHIARCGQAHMIFKNVITPCTKDIVLCVLGDNNLRLSIKFHF
jgi:hypothetical protein